MEKKGVRSAFTLIELLVVISIIALLLSILMPALGKARESARVVLCTSNARQSALLVKMYAQGNKDYYPPYAFPAKGLNFWHRPMSQAFFAGEYSYWPLLVVPEDQRVAAKAPSFLFCPSQKTRDKSDLWYAYVSYGYNYAKFGNWKDGYSAPAAVKDSMISNPSRTVLFVESRYESGTGRNAKPDEGKGLAYIHPAGPKSLHQMYTPEWSERYMANRHSGKPDKENGKVTVLWADGRATIERRIDIYNDENKWGLLR